MQCLAIGEDHEDLASVSGSGGRIRCFGVELCLFKDLNKQNDPVILLVLKEGGKPPVAVKGALNFENLC